VVLRKYEGHIPELVYIGTVLSGFYSDQILPITNKYTVTADILADTAKAFYRSFTKEIESSKFCRQQYHDILQEFAVEYISRKHNIKLKRYDDSVIGAYENPGVD
jgi:hypothetical protein